jgi:hypothetical protein
MQWMFINYCGLLPILTGFFIFMQAKNNKYWYF